jgi:hypothetical protein
MDSRALTPGVFCLGEWRTGGEDRVGSSRLGELGTLTTTSGKNSLQGVETRP